MYKNNYNNRNGKIKSDLKLKCLSYAHVYNANMRTLMQLNNLSVYYAPINVNPVGGGGESAGKGRGFDA